jgi:hypothetical protein
MAKRNRRKMDRKLPARDPRLYHPGEGATPSSSDPRLRAPSPRGSRSQLVDQRHAPSTPDRAKANDRCESGSAATPGRTPPSLHVATRGVESVAEEQPSSESSRDAPRPLLGTRRRFQSDELGEATISRCTASSGATTNHVVTFQFPFPVPPSCLGTASGP